MDQTKWTVKLKAGKWMVPVEIERQGDRLWLKFPYNQHLLDEVRAMDGSRWHGYDEPNPRKQWSIKDSCRNRFQLAYLAHPSSRDPECPYYRYDQPIKEYQLRRKEAMGHQVELVRHGLTYHYALWAADMGVGKTLAAIEVMEGSGHEDWIWVGPRSAIQAAKLEFEIWRCGVRPRVHTFESLKKLVADWPPGLGAPRGLVIDEISRCKNPTAQRTQAVQHLADAIRERWGDDGYVIGMSGSPSPKSPVDWWSLCEIICPGFLREGNPDKLKKRLAIIEERQSVTGGGYPHLVTWRDDPKKCNVCGDVEGAPQHDPSGMVDGSNLYHPFTPSVDEVSLLYKRLRGLVIVKLKKDCLDLPPLRYRVIECKPSTSVLNAARAIAVRAPSAIQALVLLRELSDGFQYADVEHVEVQCDRCRGLCQIREPYDELCPDSFPEPSEIEAGHRWVYDETADSLVPGPAIRLGERVASCPTCGGTGKVMSYRREAQQVACPKENALVELLDQHEEVGRIVICAGFTGSVDRCVAICKRAGWETVRVDGRGWHSSIPGDEVSLLKAFQRGQEKWARVAFVMQPSSGGMGITLTASPSIVYYSNDFNAESRIQSENRVHRPGMDSNLGATIYDLIHLSSDLLVLNNLRAKRRLMDMTMGQFQEELKVAEIGPRQV